MHIFKKLLNALMIAAVAAAASSCIYDDMPECPNDYWLVLRYDMNMAYANAFASQVKSVNLWVYDSDTGHLVYRFSDSGKNLADEHYRVRLPIEAGTYDILCWGGLAQGESFLLGNDMSVSLRTRDGVSDALLNDLFHGLRRRVTFIDNNTIGSTAEQCDTMPLVKDTNRINVMLHHLDGSALDPAGFAFSIRMADRVMLPDNSMGSYETVHYREWALTQAAARAGGGPLLAEFSVARLMAGRESRLVITRLSDGKDIINVPLTENLLLFRGQFHASMPAQEFLDRMDEFNLTFILDENNNWNVASMIYINSWATPPVQSQEW